MHVALLSVSGSCLYMFSSDRRGFLGNDSSYASYRQPVRKKYTPRETPQEPRRPANRHTSRRTGTHASNSKASKAKLRKQHLTPRSQNLPIWYAPNPRPADAISTKLLNSCMRALSPCALISLNQVVCDKHPQPPGLRHDRSLHSQRYG